MDFPRPEVFGNYILKDFGDIVMPADLDWWPIQPGWWVLLAMILLASAVYGYRRYRHWQRNAYRRQALADLSAMDNLRDMNVIIKRAVVAAFPADSPAMLWGDEWVNFLNSKTSTPCFSNKDAALFSSLLTQPQQQWPKNIESLRDRVQHWLLQHQEALL